MPALTKKLKGAFLGKSGSNSSPSSTVLKTKSSSKKNNKKNGGKLSSPPVDHKKQLSAIDTSIRNPARRPPGITTSYLGNDERHPAPALTDTTASSQDTMSPLSNSSPPRTFSRAKQNPSSTAASQAVTHATDQNQHQHHHDHPHTSNNNANSNNYADSIRAAAGVDSETPLTIALLKHRRLALHGHKHSRSSKTPFDIAASAHASPLNVEEQEDNEAFWHKVRLSLEEIQTSNSGIFVRSYHDPQTRATAMHDICHLIDPPLDILQTLVTVCGGASCMTKVDGHGFIALHYAVTIGHVEGAALQYLLDVNPSISRAYCSMQLDCSNKMANLTRNEVAKLLTSPLYRALQLHKPRNVVLLLHQACPSMICHNTPVTRLASDGNAIEPQPLDMIGTFGDREERNRSATVSSARSLSAPDQDLMEDTPLHLLWRRYHKEKWECEKFFAGDNSTPAIAEHRQIFRRKASETRDTMMQMMHLLNHSHYFDHTADGGGSGGGNGNGTAGTSAGECDNVYNAHYDCMVPAKNANGILHTDDDSPLQSSTAPEPQRGFIVHAAASLATKAPLDWLKVIIAKNPSEIGEQDAKGRLPVHYAAMAMGDTPAGGVGTYQGKFVLQLLLKLCPSAAQVMDDSGKLPLTLALERGGVSSSAAGLQVLYDAFPHAMENVESSGSVESYKIQTFMHKLREAIDSGSADFNLEEEAVFVVQNPTADVHDILGAMWSHKSDAGIQMLTLQTLERMARAGEGGGGTEECCSHSNEHRRRDMSMRIALCGGVSAIVHSLSAHSREAVVQEKGCLAMEALALGVFGDPAFSSASAKHGKGKKSPSRRSKNKHTTDDDTSSSTNSSVLALTELSFTAVGAISTLIRAMQDHPKDALVQSAACRALAALAVDEDAYVQIVSAGGVPSIVHAMDEHTLELKVQQEALKALCRLVEFSTPSFPLYSSEDLGILIEAAAEQFPKDCGKLAKAVLNKLYA
jgi:hypothetical protein